MERSSDGILAYKYCPAIDKTELSMYLERILTDTLPQSIHAEHIKGPNIQKSLYKPRNKFIREALLLGYPIRAIVTYLQCANTTVCNIQKTMEHTDTSNTL
jgi:hypothetical protein